MAPLGLAFLLFSLFAGIDDFPWPIVAFHPGALLALLLTPVSQIREHGIRELGWCSFSVQDTFEVLLQGCFCWGTAQDGHMPNLLQHEAIGGQITLFAIDGFLGVKVCTL
jgi:hypothetical protein